MESNRTYHYVFKYGLLGFSILFTLWSVVSWVAPEITTVNGRPGTQDPWTTIIFALCGLLTFLVFLLIRDNFAIVALGHQTVEIRRNGQRKTISWLDVEELRLIQFVYPPLYKLKTKGCDDTIWFNTEPRYISIGGVVTDMSEMGRLIQRKKKELRI